MSKQETIDNDVLNSLKEKLTFNEKDAYWLLGFNILLNTSALFLILVIPLSMIFYWSAWQILGLSLLIVIGLILLGTNEDFQSLMESLYITDVRSLNDEEREYIYSLIENVVYKVNSLKDVNLNLENFKVKVSRDNFFGAYVFGEKSLYISEGFIYDDNFTDEEREATIAHEFSHLINHDSTFMVSIMCSNFVMKVLGFCSIPFMSWRRRGSNKEGSILNIIIPIIYFIFVKLLSDGIFTILLRYYSRKVEYRCDHFSMELGYSRELKSLFQKLEYYTYNEKSFLGLLYSTHPSLNKRVLAIENFINN